MENPSQDELVREGDIAADYLEEFLNIIHVNVYIYTHNEYFKCD